VVLNAFSSDLNKARFDLYSPPDKLEKSQKARLKTVKETRDSGRVQSALNNLKVVAESQKNVMPSILEAVKAKATLGEITSVLKSVYGTHTENVNI
jgi:methylmalonyl-CoA mutase N-terminal domain/subunit